jgi:hypothetical protein
MAQGVLLLLYYSVQGKKLKYILTGILGLGDILFIIIMAFAFSWTSFIFYYIAGLVFALILWVPGLFISRHRPQLIPLAGLLAVYMIFVITVGAFIPEISRSSNFINYFFHHVS